MKYEILTDILFELLSKRKVTARYLAEKHATSERTIYRYLDILAVSVPFADPAGKKRRSFHFRFL
ncbi:MAG: HTH domain-containing protein [Christensenellaceae bacterium]